MATIEAAIVAAVTGDAGMAVLIGDRLIPDGAAQEMAYPYVTYQRITTQSATHLDGDGNLDWPRFQFDCWAKTAIEALTIAEALRTFLCPKPAADRTGAGLFFSATFQDQRGPTRDEETRNFGCSSDFFIWYERT